MSDKTKWLSIYLLVCFIPLFFYFRPPGQDLVNHSVVTNFLVFVPYIGLSLVAILGWQINQTRVFWSSLFLLTLYPFYLHPNRFLAYENPRNAAFEILSASLPLAFCLIFSLKENRLWSDRSLFRLLFALFPFALFFGLSQWEPDLYRQVFYWGSTLPNGAHPVPYLAWITTGFFVLLTVFLPDLKIKPFMISLVVILIPFFFATQMDLVTNFSGTDWTLTAFRVIVSFGVMTIILVHAILHMYWRKVYMDVLTTVPNRQALDERLHTLRKNYTLAMVDIDHFKKFNDNYGHAEGDNVLRMVAQHLEEHLGFKVYRYGGEEFCVVFEGSNLEPAHEQMDKTRHSLEKRAFRLRSNKRRKGDIGSFFTKSADSSGRKVHITISVGVAAAGKSGEDYEKVIKRADQALYQAKEKGRNKVISSEK